MIGALLALLANVLVLRGDTPAATESAPPLAFVYVEANSGGASGGHSALRIGDLVYHYRQSDECILELQREAWPTFCHAYAGLENRSVHVATLGATAADVGRIETGFARAFVLQSRDLERRRRLHADLAWWTALAADPRGLSLPPLRGAGLLEERTDDEASRELREHIGTALGPAFLAERILELDLELPDALPHSGATDLEPLREWLLRREAIVALAQARPLAADAVVDDVDRAPLSPQERVALQSVRERLASTIVGLLTSARPDRGRPLLIAIARHQAASRSLANGRPVTLDVTPDDARVVATARRDDAASAARVAGRALEMARQTRAFVLADSDDPGFDEARFNLLEESRSRLRQAERAARGAPARLFEGRAVPSRSRTVELDARAQEALGREAVRRARDARARLSDHEETLRAHYRYQLIARNCATELVRLLDDCFEDKGAVAAALGDRLEPGAGFTFIPFMLDRAVTQRLRVQRVEVIPSHRLRELERLDRTEPGWTTALREGNTLTSTIYTPRDEDGAFLFFTDDTLLLRPLAGAVNLGYGLVHVIGGILAAPFDDAELLRSGWNGAFFSLPELVFCNVRKGTFCDVEPGSVTPAPR